ncbi:hypothetical protein [Rhizobium lusitanum]|uniref:Uncharacterized protein n=1 Tax=Rhizobium lusitanum TaxID=293958 RepID=A0A7X0ISU4_9HYPH|nr:hypothetical protein [Rhizobium lusitanum]MBB6486132.1 hypothetical protein [Rhizobium lusitanum]
MTMLLYNLHLIAAERGDGLRPELLRMMMRPTVLSNIGQTGEARRACEQAERNEEVATDHAAAAGIVEFPVRNFRL